MPRLLESLSLHVYPLHDTYIESAHKHRRKHFFGCDECTPRVTR